MREAANSQLIKIDLTLVVDFVFVRAKDGLFNVAIIRTTIIVTILVFVGRSVRVRATQTVEKHQKRWHDFGKYGLQRRWFVGPTGIHQTAYTWGMKGATRLGTLC